MEFPHIDPVLFEFGFIVIRWYALAYIAGFILGWRYALYLVSGPNRPAHPDKIEIDDFLVWAIPAVILGGRAGYVLFYNFDFYLQNPTEIIQVWKGGMSFHGGILGVAVAMLLYARQHKFHVFYLSDIICAVAPIGLFFGRLANFINGELFGRVTTASWGVIFPHGGDLPRHPSQLYEAALEGIVLFLILMFLTRAKMMLKYPGVISGAFLAGYGCFRFLIEYVREPDAQLGLFFNYVSMGQILCLPMILLGIGLILYAVCKKPCLSSKNS